jgi:hypothetical protein
MLHLQFGWYFYPSGLSSDCAFDPAADFDYLSFDRETGAFAPLPTRTVMVDRSCPHCKGKMSEMDGEYVLLSGKDVPSFGSKTEVMITPKGCLRARVWRCENPSCKHIELCAA